MTKQYDITNIMRSILVDWLVEVCDEFHLLPETLFAAAAYVDRYLSHVSVPRSKLQLVGVTCLYLSAKFEEIHPPEISEFAYITDDTYTKKQVIEYREREGGREGGRPELLKWFSYIIILSLFLIYR